MLAICTPVRREVDCDFLTSLHKTMEGGGISWIHCTGHANLPRARNFLVQRARERGAEQIIFIDDDIGWEPEAIGQLFDCPDDVRVVGGCPQRRVDGVVAFASIPDSPISRRSAQLVTGVAATSFLRVSASVFDDLENKVEHYIYNGRTYPAFFQTPVIGNDLLDEDVFFSRKCRENGIDVWLDPTIKLRHWHKSPLTAVMADHIRFEPIKESA